MSPFEVTWEKTLLILPPDVPMWGQMEESGDCCGFIQKKSGELKWRVARHGRFQLNKDKMQIKETDLSAHLPVYIHLCESRAKKKKGAHAVRPPSSTENNGTERRREKKEEGENLRSVTHQPCPLARAEVLWTLQRLLLFSSPEPR